MSERPTLLGRSTSVDLHISATLANACWTTRTTLRQLSFRMEAFLQMLQEDLSFAPSSAAQSLLHVHRVVNQSLLHLHAHSWMQQVVLEILLCLQECLYLSLEKQRNT